MKVLITGALGFIGKNLIVRLLELKKFTIFSYSKVNTIEDLTLYVEQAEIIVHLAGEMRPVKDEDFINSNYDLTKKICEIIKKNGHRKLLLFASTIQAEQKNSYGQSKLLAENELINLSNESKSTIVIYRLPHVFGKWCKPNYNSVIATFCHNVSRDLPIVINDPDAIIRPVYIDDVVTSFIKSFENFQCGVNWVKVEPEYQITVGELAEKIIKYKTIRVASIADNTCIGLNRALYSTYISYLPTNQFSYRLNKQCNSIGTLVSFLGTKDSGKVSYLAIKPGGIWKVKSLNSNLEKLIVVEGIARIFYRSDLQNKILNEVITSEMSKALLTMPGWDYEIENIGVNELIIIFWINDLSFTFFDKSFN